LDRLKTIGAYGDLERAYAQQKLDAQYQDILRNIGYPEEQLGKMANILRGVPLGDTLQTSAQTTPPPSFASQLAGLGLSGLSMYNLFNR
jgi:predicted metalloprotease with PDZ domain